METLIYFIEGGALQLDKVILTNQFALASTYKDYQYYFDFIIVYPFDTIQPQYFCL